MALFENRVDAGRQLADHLEHLRGGSMVILGLPRGGVPVAFEVAVALDAPLDLIVVRKLGVPFQPELAFGAIGEGQTRVINADLVTRLGLSDRQVGRIEARERAELNRLSSELRTIRSRVPLSDKTAVIVDDGIATGATAEAACRVARAGGAARVVLAAPVAAATSARALADVADEVVCVAALVDFGAVGHFYRDFRATSIDEVVTLLGQAKGAIGDTNGSS